jgi:hypothetical protein
MTIQAPPATLRWPMAKWPEIKTILDPIVYFYELLLPLEKVVALYANRHSDGFDVWVVADDTTVTDREQIYDQEWALMQQFPDLGFDFRLVDRAQSAPTEMVNLDSVDIFLRFPRFSHA